jgi:hypothetical protein
VYFKNSIFTFGGGTVLGTTLVTTMFNPNLYEIDLSKLCSSLGTCSPQCSIGTFNDGEECIPCEKGSYSDSYGNSSCTLCPAGTYNANPGANSNRQCYPCPRGSYNNIEGNWLCFDCPAGTSCPAGSKLPYNDPISPIISTVQPAAFVLGTSAAASASFNLYMTIMGTGVLLLIIFYVLYIKKSSLLKKFDVYKQIHTYNLNEEMILQQTNY